MVKKEVSKGSEFSPTFSSPISIPLKQERDGKEEKRGGIKDTQCTRPRKPHPLLKSKHRS